VDGCIKSDISEHPGMNTTNNSAITVGTVFRTLLVISKAFTLVT